jgi:AcrR family transcriptional regulator
MAAGQSSPSIWMRPERAALGRPAQRSRAEITAAAIGIADREGLDAVSMRRVAAELGTGAASLYRYVETREDLLDLMTDAAGGEDPLPEPSGDWLADLVAVAGRSREILRRHPWLADLAITRPVLGPNGVAVLEHVLTVLAPHPADLGTKMEAFAVLNGLTALYARHELAGGSALQQRNATYLHHAATSGEHPRLTRLLSQAPAVSGPAEEYDLAERFEAILARILTGVLGEAPGSTRPAAPAEE